MGIWAADAGTLGPRLLALTATAYVPVPRFAAMGSPGGTHSHGELHGTADTRQFLVQTLQNTATS